MEALILVVVFGCLGAAYLAFDPVENLWRLNDAEARFKVAREYQTDQATHCFKPQSKQYQKSAYRNSDGSFGVGFICVP